MLDEAQRRLRDLRIALEEMIAERDPEALDVRGESVFARTWTVFFIVSVGTTRRLSA